MKSFFLFALIVSCISSNAQRMSGGVLTDTAKLNKREFRNQGEQEVYWAEQLFKNDYREEYYSKYKVRIIENGDNYNYNGIVLIVVNSIRELKDIINQGIFYPDIISQSFVFKPSLKIRLQTDTAAQLLKNKSKKVVVKHLNDIVSKDSLTISNFEELRCLNITPTKRRFRFWLYTKGFANPTVCFLELTNSNASGKTSLASFIKGAQLTFFKKGWVII